MARPDDHNARIDRMEQDGLLTASQAQRLRDSLHPPPPHDDQEVRKLRFPKSLAGGLLIIALFALLVFGVLVPEGAAPPVQDVAKTLNQPGGVGEMNTTLSKIIAIAVLLIVPLLAWVWMHNSLVAKEEKVFEAWAQTESNYQRRADLIPALVDSVSRFIRHEAETLTTVTAERSQANERLTETVDQLIRAQEEVSEILRAEPKSLLGDEEKLARLYAGQASVGRGLGSLFAVAESYPELRSADQFLELQAQLEGTENRINVARIRFNDAVGDFNATMRKLPWSLIASAGNFQRKAYFQSDEEAKSAPELKFE